MTVYNFCTCIAIIEDVQFSSKPELCTPRGEHQPVEASSGSSQEQVLIPNMSKTSEAVFDVHVEVTTRI